MIQIGKLNNLPVIKEVDFGVYLDGGEEVDSILLPRKEVPKGTKISDVLCVFLYFDSEDRLIATTREPYAMVGDFALLKVKAVNQVGAFLDWGLSKDLLVPFREQKKKMEEGRSYIVYVYYDEDTHRIAASAKLGQFFDPAEPEYTVGSEVELLIWQKSDLGYKVIIDHRYPGMLFSQDVFQTLHIGEVTLGYIKQLREDGKIDVSLAPRGYIKVEDNLQKILDYIEQEGGFAPISDKTPPQEIYDLFGISKKTFKSALGALYKQGKISLEDQGVKLLKKP